MELQSFHKQRTLRNKDYCVTTQPKKILEIMEAIHLHEHKIIHVLYMYCTLYVHVIRFVRSEQAVGWLYPLSLGLVAEDNSAEFSCTMYYKCMQYMYIHVYVY